MTIEILRTDAADLPAAEDAAALLEAAGETLTLTCTDADLTNAYRVLRTLMDYGYEHPLPERVRLLCTSDAAYRTYRFQWNMWYAEHKPED